MFIILNHSFHASVKSFGVTYSSANSLLLHLPLLFFAPPFLSNLPSSLLFCVCVVFFFFTLPLPFHFLPSPYLLFPMSPFLCSSLFFSSFSFGISSFVSSPLWFLSFPPSSSLSVSLILFDYSWKEFPQENFISKVQFSQ